MQEIEIWKDVSGYEGYYQVSSFGRVKSLSRNLIASDGRRYRHNGRILACGIDHYGYQLVVFSVNNKQQTKKVHRLVCAAYHENPENKRCVNHKDGIKTHNYESNLEWATHSENNLHAYKLGLSKPTMPDHVGKFGAENANSKPVLQYSKSGVFIKRFDSQADATRATGLSKYCISKACTKVNQTSGGFVWEFE